MDTQRSGDAAGAGGIPLSLLDRSSNTRAHTLAGAPAAGGLLATFDAIFRQTLAPQPPLHPVAPAPVAAHAPSPEDRGERLESRAVPSEEDDLDEEREIPAATAQPPLTASGEPSTAAEEPADSSLPSKGTTAESSQVDAESQRPEDPSTESEQDAAEAATETPTVAAESAASVSPEATADHGPATAAAADAAAPTADAIHPAEAAPAEAAPVAAGPVPSVQATQSSTEQTTPAQATAEATSAAGEPSTAGGEPLPAAETAAGEPAGDEVLPVAEDAGDQEGSTERRPSRHRDGADRGRGERNEAVGTGEGKRAGGAVEAAGERPLDQLLAQMQPVDSASEAAARPAAVPMPANITAAAAAAAPTSAAGSASQAPSSSGGDSSAAENRLGFDGAEPRRSVGGLKTDAADGQTQTTSGAERVRLIQRVARAFQRLGPTGGRVQVMLHPAALGSVRLDLRVDGNRMDARMTAETEAARSVLREHLPELRQRLADSGLVVERIEIDLDSRSPDSQTAGDRAEQGSDQSGWRRSDSQSTPQRRNLPPTAPATPRHAAAPHRVATGLDLMA